MNNQVELIERFCTPTTVETTLLQQLDDLREQVETLTAERDAAIADLEKVESTLDAIRGLL